MIDLTKENFDTSITNKEGLVLVEFWSPGCGPCRQMELMLTMLEPRYPQVCFARMNSAAYPDVAWAFGVEAAPSLVLFRNGVPVYVVTGAVPVTRVEELLCESKQGVL
jgi:thioredoxin 1